jgi:hypothetical protein
MPTSIPIVPADDPIAKDIDWIIEQLPIAQRAGAFELLAHQNERRLNLWRDRAGPPRAVLAEIIEQREAAADLVRYLPLTYFEGRPTSWTAVRRPDPDGSYCASKEESAAWLLDVRNWEKAVPWTEVPTAAGGGKWVSP